MINRVRDAVIGNVITIIACVLRGRRAAYISGPITSGKRLFALKNAALPRQYFEHELHTAVIEPNIKAIEGLVKRWKRRSRALIIDPSKLPFLPGWKQVHYYKLWTEIIREYVSETIFLDGWEYSSGCVCEFVETVDQGIPALDANGGELNREMGIKLIENAIQEIFSSNLDAPSLRNALRRLKTGEGNDDLSDLFLTTREQATVAATLLGSVINSRSAVLVASPISTGKRFVDWMRRKGKTVDPASLSDQKSLAEAVTEPNIEDHWRFVRIVEQSAKSVIDLTRYAPVDWSREDHEALRNGIMKQYVTELFLADKWYYSSECLVLYRSAAKAGVRVVDGLARTVTLDSAVALIRTGATYCETIPEEAQVFREVLRDLAHSETWPKPSAIRIGPFDA